MVFCSNCTKSNKNLKCCKLHKPLLLTAQHRNNILNFARNHLNWDEEGRNVILQIKRLCLDGSNAGTRYFHDLEKKNRFWSHHDREAEVMCCDAIWLKQQLDWEFKMPKATKNCLQEQKHTQTE